MPRLGGCISPTSHLLAARTERSCCEFDLVLEALGR